MSKHIHTDSLFTTCMVLTLLYTFIVGCSDEQEPVKGEAGSIHGLSHKKPGVENSTAVTKKPEVPENVPCPRGLKVLKEDTSDRSGKLVIYAVTRKEVVNEAIPYLEYLASSKNAKEALVYLFDREEQEAGVPLEPVDYFRFFLGQIKIKDSKGAFIENPDYLKDDGDPTPNGADLELALAIWRWRKKNGMTELGREKESAEAYAREKGLDPKTTWIRYAKVLDDSISLGEKHFLKQEEKPGKK